MNKSETQKEKRKRKRNENMREKERKKFSCSVSGLKPPRKKISHNSDMNNGGRSFMRAKKEQLVKKCTQQKRSSFIPCINEITN